jgi:hypothetical protein
MILIAYVIPKNSKNNLPYDYFLKVVTGQHWYVHSKPITKVVST